MQMIHMLKEFNVKVGIASSSKNTPLILERAGIDLDSLFDNVLDIGWLFMAKVDGNDLEKYKLKGKPHGDIFVKCAEMLGVAPSQAIVVEDAVSGIQAAVDGKFGLALGLNRTGHR
jgi:beta-phosphoglucomutase-like phosphatase (HAD superfamily)